MQYCFYQVLYSGPKRTQVPPRFIDKSLRWKRILNTFCEEYTNLKFFLSQAIMEILYLPLKLAWVKMGPSSQYLLGLCSMYNPICIMYCIMYLYTVFVTYCTVYTYMYTYRVYIFGIIETSLLAPQWQASEILLHLAIRFVTGQDRTATNYRQVLSRGRAVIKS